jgi:hypothetical protein
MTTEVSYDLTKDADKLLKGMDVSSKCGFSLVAHSPQRKVPEEEEIVSQFLVVVADS